MTYETPMAEAAAGSSTFTARNTSDGKTPATNPKPSFSSPIVSFRLSPELVDTPAAATIPSNEALSTSNKIKNSGGSTRTTSAFTPVQPNFQSSTQKTPPTRTPSARTPERPKATPYNRMRTSNAAYAAATVASMTSSTRKSKSTLSGLVILSPSRTLTETLNTLVSTTAQQLEAIWDEVGYNPEERASQLSELVVNIRDLCENKIAEEQGVAETFRNTIAETKMEIRATEKALQVPEYQWIEQSTLTDELAFAEAALEGLKETALIARKDLKDSQRYLMDAHIALGLELDVEWLDIDADLTQSRRQRFHQKVDEMKDEVATRSSAIVQLLRDCQHLMNDLRVNVTVTPPVSPGQTTRSLDHLILSSLVRTEEDGTYTLDSIFRTDTCTGISAETLAILTERVDELTAEKRRRTVELQEMGADIMVLWEKLGVTEEEQRAFSQGIQGLGLDTIEKGKAELERLQTLKSEMMGQLVSNVRKQVEDLWNQMDASAEYRKTFEPFAVQDEDLFNDELLEKHEEYIAALQVKLEEMKPLLRIIERRELIVRERIEYQELQKDSDRLKRRGADLTRQLMHEEKMARRIKKELPKVSAMLVENLKEWKQKHDEDFQLHGESYLEIMQRQEEEWELYREKEMQMKLKKKEKEAENQVVGMKFAPLRGKKTRPLGDARNRENIANQQRSNSRSRGDISKDTTRTAGGSRLRGGGRSTENGRSNSRVRPRPNMTVDTSTNRYRSQSNPRALHA